MGAIKRHNPTGSPTEEDIIRPATGVYNHNANISDMCPFLRDPDICVGPELSFRDCLHFFLLLFSESPESATMLFVYFEIHHIYTTVGPEKHSQQEAWTKALWQDEMWAKCEQPPPALIRTAPKESDSGSLASLSATIPSLHSSSGISRMLPRCRGPTGP